jgi:AbiV family abortive infection protein
MNTGLSKNDILGLFNASIDNAFSLWSISNQNITNKDTMHISLGLSELALEELGKSYTCLAYYCISNDTDYMKYFWQEWKNHKLKAHRAFFYEFFSLFRIEISASKKYIPTIRKSMPLEKETSFYVDYDHINKKVIRPFSEIEKEEIVNRITSVIGPLYSAKNVSSLIVDNNNEDYTTAISKYAFHTLTCVFYQQDIEKELQKLKNNNLKHDEAIDDIWKLFNTKIKI